MMKPPSESGCSLGADHSRRLMTGGLGHWFSQLRDEARVDGVSLHRPRHTFATYLVGRGDLLQAQQRLGHRDAATTLRNYGHAMPLHDEAAAGDIDEMLRQEAAGTHRSQSPTDTLIQTA